jgi:hypothetical protein
MALWVYDEKFLTGVLFLFRMLPFTVGEDDCLEHRLKNKKSGAR